MTGTLALSNLPPGECRRLLSTSAIGRLGYTVGALPTIQPVHFAVRGDEVLIPARRGGTVEGASRGAVVAFEVDEYDTATRTGWSVTVVGPSRVLSDAGEVARLEEAGLTPWAPVPNGCVVAVRIAQVTGRRLFRDRPSPGWTGAQGASRADDPPVP